MILRHTGTLQGFGIPCKTCLSRYATRPVVTTLGKGHGSPTTDLQGHQYVFERQRKSLLRTHSSLTSEDDAPQIHEEEESTIGGVVVESSAAQHWLTTPKDGLIQAARSTPPKYQPLRRRRATRRVAPTSSALRRKSSSNQPFNLVSLALWGQSNGRRGRNDVFEKFSPLIWTWYRTLAHIRNGQVAISYHVAPGSLGSKFLAKTEQEMLSTWKMMYSKLKWARLQQFWQRVMLWTLQHDHDKALTFLEATISDLHNRAGATRYAIEAALEFLTTKHLRGQVVDMEIKDRLHRLLCQFAEANNLGNNRSSSPMQKVIHLLLRHSDHDQAEILYDTVVKSQLKLHCNSLTHFTDKFAQRGRPDMAMDALRRIMRTPADASSDIVQYSCITLLRSPFDGIERYRVQSHLVTEMLEMGIRPGIPMLNAMISNAVEAGDYQTAYAIFETARIHGIRRDTITYSTLLKVALYNLDDNLVEKIMLMAEEDGALPRNNQLVFCLVATIMQITRAEGTRSALWISRYRRMLQIYARYCDIGPLQELGIYVNIPGDFGSPGPISQPSPRLLSVMILGYIRLFGQPSPIQDLYTRWQAFLTQNHRLIARTAETQHLANAFLLCLGQHKATFAMCPTILRNMLEPPTSTIIKVAKPNVQTWSVLLRSYFFNGQRAAGEKIIQMMRERGIKPNIVTMNTIIAGYAGLQDASAAVNTMQQMEAAGFEADSSTYKGLTRLVNREQLLDALRTVAVTTDKAQEAAQGMEDSRSFANADLQTPQAAESNKDSLLCEAVQHNGQKMVDTALHQSVTDSDRSGVLDAANNQREHGHQKEARTDSKASALQMLDLVGNDSYLYKILDTPPNAP